VLGKQALHLGDEGVPTGTRSGFRLRALARKAAQLREADPSLRSGFRLRAPAALTPAKRLN
jgi:hypothetical protein